MLIISKQTSLYLSVRRSNRQRTVTCWMSLFNFPVCWLTAFQVSKALPRPLLRRAFVCVIWLGSVDLTHTHHTGQRIDVTPAESFLYGATSTKKSTASATSFGAGEAKMTIWLTESPRKDMTCSGIFLEQPISTVWSIRTQTPIPKGKVISISSTVIDR